MQLAIRCRNRGRSDRKQITVFHYTVQPCRNTGQINKQLLLLGICSLSAEEIGAKVTGIHRFVVIECGYINREIILLELIINFSRI